MKQKRKMETQDNIIFFEIKENTKKNSSVVSFFDSMSFKFQRLSPSQAVTE